MSATNAPQQQQQRRRRRPPSVELQDEDENINININIHDEMSLSITTETGSSSSEETETSESETSETETVETSESESVESESVESSVEQEPRGGNIKSAPTMQNKGQPRECDIIDDYTMGGNPLQNDLINDFANKNKYYLKKYKKCRMMALKKEKMHRRTKKRLERRVAFWVNEWKLTLRKYGEVCDDHMEIMINTTNAFKTMSRFTLHAAKQTAAVIKYSLVMIIGVIIASVLFHNMRKTEFTLFNDVW
jgi:hypothetical protein